MACEAPKVKKLSKTQKVVLAQKRAEIEASIKKKRECEKIAMTIVEHLIDTSVDAEFLLENAHKINKSYYQDVTEERALSLLCGYPLCPRKIEKVLKQKYVINLAARKVYDVTNRKNFCSNVCFQASTFFKDQLLDSPLWLRDSEPVPKYRITLHAKGLCGDEVTIAAIALPENEKDDVEQLVETIKSSLEIVEDASEQPSSALKESPVCEKVTKKRNPIHLVTTALKQWITSDTLNHLIREQDGEQFNTYEEDYIQKHRQLCCRLDIQEAQDAVIDRHLIIAEKSTMESVISYDQLKDQMEQVELKVRAFYAGQWQYADEKVQETTAEEQNTDQSPVVMPLVDSLAQKALRRRIIMDSLDRSIPSLLKILGLNFDELREDVKALVWTFDLTASTITFRPDELNLVSLVLIKLMSLKDSKLRRTLTEHESQLALEKLLSSYDLNATFLDNLVVELRHSSTHSLENTG